MPSRRIEAKEVSVVEASKEQIVRLEQEIRILMEKNRGNLENSYADGLNVLRQLKEGLLIVENMTAIERREFLGYVDFLFDNFVTRLCTEYRLKESNLLLAAFIKLGFSSEELVILFDSELEAVRKRKQRLKNKLGLDNKVNLDVFWLTILVKCPAKSLVASISSLLLVDNDEKSVLL